MDISQHKLRNLKLINCSGEQCSPENSNSFPLSYIEHIKNGEQCSLLQKPIKGISLIKTNLHHNYPLSIFTS